MEINLSNSGFGGIGIGREKLGEMGVDAEHPATGEPQGSSRKSLSVSSLASGAKTAGLAASEPVADVPDSALSRDDALGRLVAAAFNFPPPPMPVFAG